MLDCCIGEGIDARHQVDIRKRFPIKRFQTRFIYANQAGIGQRWVELPLIKYSIGVQRRKQPQKTASKLVGVCVLPIRNDLIAPKIEPHTPVKIRFSAVAKATVSYDNQGPRSHLVFSQDGGKLKRVEPSIVHQFVNLLNVEAGSNVLIISANVFGLELHDHPGNRIENIIFVFIVWIVLIVRLLLHHHYEGGEWRTCTRPSVSPFHLLVTTMSNPIRLFHSHIAQTYTHVHMYISQPPFTRHRNRPNCPSMCWTTTHRSSWSPEASWAAPASWPSWPVLQ